MCHWPLLISTSAHKDPWGESRKPQSWKKSTAIISELLTWHESEWKTDRLFFSPRNIPMWQCQLHAPPLWKFSSPPPNSLNWSTSRLSLHVSVLYRGYFLSGKSTWPCCFLRVRRPSPWTFRKRLAAENEVWRKENVVESTSLLFVISVKKHKPAVFDCVCLNCFCQACVTVWGWGEVLFFFFFFLIVVVVNLG